MTIRSLTMAFGLALCAMGSAGAMQMAPNQEEMMEMMNRIMAMSEQEARDFVYAQHDPEVQKAFDAVFGSLRGLTLEGVLAFLVIKSQEGWTQTGLLALLGGLGLIDVLNLPGHALSLRIAVEARERDWNQLKSIRAAIATRRDQAATEQELLGEQSTEVMQA